MNKGIINEQEKLKRNIFLRIIFGISWFIIIYLVTNFIIGGVVGGIAGASANNYAAGSAAGREAGVAFFHKYGLIVLIIQILSTAVLSLFGILPGTGKFKRNKNKETVILKGVQAISPSREKIDKILSPAEQNRQTGLIMLSKGDYASAVETFSQAISIDSRYGPAYHNRGFARFNLGNYKEAIEDFSEAIELDPDYAEHARTAEYLNLAKQKI